MRALVVEDDPALREQVCRHLTDEGDAVDSAADGEQGLYMAVEYPVDIAIVDLGLPKTPGIAIIKAVRKAGRSYPILILTARDEPAQVVELLNAGADDYLTKPFVLAEFLARVRALVRRGFHKGNARLRYADLELDRHRRRATRGKEIIPLTSKEFALLELFLLHAPDLVTRSEIVEHVWDYHFDSETNLVEVYINRLRQKIDLNGTTKLIHTVRGVGYRLGMPE